MDSKNDTLGLGGNVKVSRMLSKKGDNSPHPEVVKFSNYITKINKRGKEQHRTLLLTDKAIYNLMPTAYDKCNRRIDLRNVIGVTASCTGPEFVVHVPKEYDYRFKSPTKELLLDVLQEVHTQLPGNTNRNLVRYVPETDLSTITMTKDKGKLMTREERQKRQEQLLEQLGKQDKEEEQKEAKSDAKYTAVPGMIQNSQRVDLRDFTLKKVLGRGSFGKVMLVQKKDDQKYYAMKILRKDYIIKKNQVEHTQAERAILQQLNHPFLMQLRYAFQSPAKLYLVLDFFQGGEMFFHLKKKRRFSERCAKIYVGEIALALGHLHSLDVIYRDLKPENILLDPQGHVCLTDFGLAKEIKDGELTDSFCGTPEYLAPEIVAGLGHDKAVDWWSLGILLYELTVGIPPFYSQNINDMYNKIQHGVLRFPPFLSDECKSLIVALLHRTPSKRCGSTNDVSDLKSHAFFADIDWDRMYAKQIVPDYRPDISADQAMNFDDEFKNEQVVDTYIQASTLVKQNTDTFNNFTFQQNNTIG